MISLIKLTENDKRILIVVFLAIIIIFLFIGFIVNLVKRVMAKQGKAVDTYMYNLVKAKLVTTPHQFRKVSEKKNIIMFYKKIRLPFVLILIGLIILAQYMIIAHTSNLSFYFSKEHGINSLLYHWDWGSVEKATLLGIKTFIPATWPELIWKPTFVFDHQSITAYLSFPCFVVGGILYIHQLVAYISRQLRARQLSTSVFQKSLTPEQTSL